MPGSDRLFAAGLLLTLAAAPLAAQSAGVFRIYQGNTELGREHFRVTGDTLELESVVPVVNLRARSRTVLERTGGVADFQLTVSNATGDSTRRSYRAERLGDSLQVTGLAGRTARLLGPAARPAAVAAPQSVYVFAALAERAAGRDTTVPVWVPGPDTLLPATVQFSPDSVTIRFVGLEMHGRWQAGRVTELVIPAQRVRAVLAGPGDSLPPLSGLRAPTPNYAAPAGAAWTAVEVRVPAGAAPDTFSLGCTLTSPAGGTPPFAAAVTITGSGQQTRDASLWPLLRDYRLFGQVAERLSAAGIAVLRCDDRGAGSSGGRADTATTADLAEDTRAQVRWLRARPEIDQRRIALIGHSEGGLIAPLLGAQERSLAALVIMAGPAKNGTEILVDQVRWPILMAPGLSDSARAAQLLEAERQVRADSMPALRWMRWFRHYEPLKAARLLEQPVLILHGALDRQVTVGQADTLATTIRRSGNRRVEVQVFPGLNHLFLPSPTDGSPSEYATLAETRVPEAVLSGLTGWLTRVLRAE